MAKYRKKPVIVEAEQFHIMQWPNCPEGVIRKTADETVNGETTGRGCEWFTVITIHGQETTVVDGDWIIQEPDGEHYYPCKPDIFAETYELVEE